MKKKRLTIDFREYSMEFMEDRLMAFMATIENAMLQCGAIPGEDYTFKDLMTWAISLESADESTRSK